MRVPLIARNLLESIQLLASDRADLRREVRRAGSRPTRRAAERSAEATLAAATALNPYIGYDKAAEIVKEAASSGRMLREVAYEKGVDEETYNKAMDLREMARGQHVSRVPPLGRQRQRRDRSAVQRRRAAAK